MNLLYPVLTGIIAAGAHVISGPDHLAAVAPFAVDSRKSSWRIGVFWGLGHLAGMLVIGLLFTFLQNLPPVEKISAFSEELVGVVLVGIGIWALLRATNVIRMHKPHQDVKASSNRTHMASFSIGSLHGLAGIAHFLLFLPVLGFESVSESTLYIVGFAVGTLLAMTSFTFLIGWLPAISGGQHKTTWLKGLRISAGIAAIVIGVYWVVAN